MSTRQHRDLVGVKDWLARWICAQDGCPFVTAVLGADGSIRIATDPSANINRRLEFTRSYGVNVVICRVDWYLPVERTYWVLMPDEEIIIPIEPQPEELDDDWLPPDEMFCPVHKVAYPFTYRDVLLALQHYRKMHRRKRYPARRLA